MAAPAAGLLRGLGQREVVLVFDPTPYRGDATILVVGVVVRHRVLPVLWRVVPQQDPWPERLPALLTPMLRAVARPCHPGATATLLADRGLVGPGLIDAARAAGIPLVLRLRAGAHEATRVRLGDGPEQRLAELPTGPGQRLAGPAAIFKDAGWREGFLTIHWDRAAAEPWVLFSDRPAGAAPGPGVPPPRARRGHLPGREIARLPPGGQQTGGPGAHRAAAAGGASGAVVGLRPRLAGGAHRPAPSLRPPRPARPEPAPPGSALPAQAPSTWTVTSPCPFASPPPAGPSAGSPETVRERAPYPPLPSEPGEGECNAAVPLTTGRSVISLPDWRLAQKGWSGQLGSSR